MNYKVSFIIPAYNAEKYIERCLESIIKQEFKDFEIVIVDDCSKDSTITKINEFFVNKNLKNYIFIKNEVNSGPSLTRKKAIEAATGDYLCFVDSDDFIEQDYSKQLDSVLSVNDSDILIFTFNSVYSNGKVIPHKTINPEMNNKENLIALGPDSLCCTMIRKTLFENISFPDIRNGEDMALMPVLFSRATKCSIIDRPLYNYIYSPVSASKQSNKRIVESLKKSFEYIENNVPEEYSDEVEFLGIRNFLYGGILSLLKNSKSIRTAKTYYNDFKSKYPVWNENKYIKYLPRYKRIYLKCLKNNAFFLCRILSIIHKLISK